MTKREIVIKEVEQLPEGLLDELLEFLRYLSSQSPNGSWATAFASESALQKDWLKPEEDAAWQHL